MFKKNKAMPRGRRGFTLIELLVVIAIIGVLASVTLASLNSTRKKARDARRVADVKQLQLALELFFDSNRTYPDTATWETELVTAGVIPSAPKDPWNNVSYSYELCSAERYHIGASLEESSTALNSDFDGDPTGCIAGWGSDAAKCKVADYGSYCYDVTQ